MRPSAASVRGRLNAADRRMSSIAICVLVSLQALLQPLALRRVRERPHGSPVWPAWVWPAGQDGWEQACCWLLVWAAARVWHSGWLVQWGVGWRPDDCYYCCSLAREPRRDGMPRWFAALARARQERTNGSFRLRTLFAALPAPKKVDCALWQSTFPPHWVWRRCRPVRH